MTAPIEIVNRRTGRVEKEPICGEWFLRFAYGTVLGRFLQACIGSAPFLSRIAAWYANGRRSAGAILPFVRRHAIPIGESLVPVEQFASFAEFFSRRLRPDARPIDGCRGGIVAPADGRYFAIAELGRQEKLSIKGRRLRLEELLGSAVLAQKFFLGNGLICRLSPLDYHRFHFPCDGVPSAVQALPGRLHSVHPLALRRRFTLSQNRRFLTRLVADCGEVAMVEVGATFVGTVSQTFTPHRHCKKGSEKGFFSFGGSAILLLFEKGSVALAEDLLQNSGNGMETLLHMGERIAMQC
ncbi:MAG: archaetidylserine decarboxylase [Puniceicoccales bacterium]|jgi:phosphatidylserine decarboxylase|nr:archaetidylserine decarboxylase [Puniceicoccales bacterium]